MKTMEQWNGSGLSLTKFLQVGDDVDESIMDHVIGCLPPVTMNGKMVQMGEPYSHDRYDRPMYITFESKGAKWVYTGISITPDSLKLYAEINHFSHDISGIEKAPEKYWYYKSDGVYYPKIK